MFPWLAAAQDSFSFEGETVEHPEGKASQSQHFLFTLTGDGTTDNCEWVVKEDASAPSPKSVLAILRADAVDTCWPMGLLKGAKRYQDFTVSVRFKVLGGTVNQAGGVVFRAVDADHCYLVRASALDNSIALYRVNKAERHKLGTAKANVSTDRWHKLGVTAKGSELQVFFNDAKVLTTKDAVYPLGKVGVCTQADSVTHFDDFTITGATE